jgi:hypothetical protein
MADLTPWPPPAAAASVSHLEVLVQGHIGGLQLVLLPHLLLQLLLQLADAPLIDLCLPLVLVYGLGEVGQLALHGGQVGDVGRHGCWWWRRVPLPPLCVLRGCDKFALRFRVRERDAALARERAAGVKRMQAAYMHDAARTTTPNKPD